MRLAIDRLQAGVLTPAQIAASHEIMGIDRQLIADRTYFCLFAGPQLVGCGGWSARRTLFGGDHSLAQRAPERLDPATEPARIRAMYTHPDHARRGVGSRILALSEAAARGAGFEAAELMATRAGEPFYAAAGYRVIERTAHRGANGALVPLVRMGKRLERAPA
nr:GNAT family N-acetyltransferase [Sphingomicrobium astaxanthinifaciens]